MRELRIPESGAKRKLLDEAEALFAAKGFDAVSVRDITQAAGMNVAAVNYHFGSRETLLTLVMMRYMVPVTEERLARLDAAERKYPARTVPLEEILEALVRPLVTQVRKSELAERLFYKLVGRIFAQQADGLPEPVAGPLRETVERFGRAFARALPGVPPEELGWRIHFMVGGMIHMLANQETVRSLAGAAVGTPTMETVVARFIRFAAAGLREGVETADEPVKKGPQATFDF